MKAACPGARSCDDSALRGAAAVEFAFIFPLFLMLVLGTIEIGRALDVSVTMASAVREGGRVAAMNINNYVRPGEDPNQKVEQDIRNFLTASGIDGSAVIISITEATGQSPANFDMSDPNNRLRLFRITCTVPYTSVSTFPLRVLGDSVLRSSVVFRMGQSTAQ